MATLLYIITEGVQGGPFELTEGTHILGSAEGSAIFLQDSTISAQHGQFTVSEGQIVYQDLGSQNGSFVSPPPDRLGNAVRGMHFHWLRYVLAWEAVSRFEIYHAIGKLVEDC